MSRLLLPKGRCDDCGADAVSLGDLKPSEVPERLAIVLGSEHEGVSVEMVSHAAKVIFIPMTGFVESLNVGAAAALVIQKMLELCPDARGDLTLSEKAALRRQWYAQLAHGEMQQRVFSWHAETLNKQLCE